MILCHIKSRSVMLSLSWDCRRITLTNYLKKGQTLASAYNCTLLSKLRNVLNKKKRSIIIKDPGFHPDNAFTHTFRDALKKSK
ncbi:hypothetical protein TNCV_5119341 [Trichonephila clavipes]|nr:hypothetical protein TNCV_5119341 [Trichonephila clavipes]